MKKKIIIGIIIFIGAIIFIASLSGDSETSKVSSNTSVNEATPSTQTNEKKYVEIFTFEGNGAKSSEPFTITGDRFKIRYDCKGSLCQAWAKSTKNEYSMEIIMNAEGPLNDETIIYGSGEYYIESNSSGTFKMVVEDYK